MSRPFIELYLGRELVLRPEIQSVNHATWQTRELGRFRKYPIPFYAINGKSQQYV
jgi:hypothetical protein